MSKVYTEEDKYKEICSVFDITLLMYIWDTQTDEYKTKTSVESDFFTEDVFDNEALYPGIQLWNISPNPQEVKITALYDGEERTWKEKVLEADTGYGFALKAFEVGTHTVIWYINDVEVANITYTIHQGSYHTAIPCITVKTQNAIALRDLDGSVIERVSRGTTFDVYEYSDVYDMFQVTYKYVTYFINGTGLEIQKDGIWQSITKEELKDYFGY